MSEVTQDVLANETTAQLNATLLLADLVPNKILEDVDNMCGARFCPGDAIGGANPNLKPPPASKINLIAGIYLACMIAACLVVALGVDSLNRYCVFSVTASARDNFFVELCWAR